MKIRNLIFCFLLLFNLEFNLIKFNFYHLRIIKIPCYMREVNLNEIEQIIKSRINNIKAIVLDLNGTITSLLRMPEKEMLDLLNYLNENGLPLAILTTTPFIAKIKLGNNFYIGRKRNIVDFMKKYNLKQEELVIIANDFLGPDKILLEEAPHALIFNVGYFSQELAPNLITTKIKGPPATKEILKLIFYYKFKKDI